MAQNSKPQKPSRRWIVILVVIDCVFAVWLLTYRRHDSLHLASLEHGNRVRSCHIGETHIFVDRNGRLRWVYNGDGEPFEYRLYNAFVTKSRINDLSMSVYGKRMLNYAWTPLYDACDGYIKLDEPVYDLPCVKENLDIICERWGNDIIVSLFVDKDLPLGKLAPILEAIRRTGIHDVRLVGFSKKKNALRQWNVVIGINNPHPPGPIPPEVPF